MIGSRERTLLAAVNPGHDSLSASFFNSGVPLIVRLKTILAQPVSIQKRPAVIVLESEDIVPQA